MFKVLIFDIETAPNVSFTWGKYQQDVIDFVEESYMLCFAYKWHGEQTIRVRGLNDYEDYKPSSSNDLQLITELWDLFNQADIIIAHNGDAFDIKYANGRFLKHGMIPPTTYRTIDTLKTARRRFKLNSNKLNDLAKLLDIGTKVQTGGFELWKRCMAGDKKAWATMKKYNKHDVQLLEDVYHKLLPWVPNHPNLGLFEENVCPSCGSDDIHKKGFHYTNMRKHQRYKCMACGANSYKPITSAQIRSL